MLFIPNSVNAFSCKLVISSDDKNDSPLQWGELMRVKGANNTPRIWTSYLVRGLLQGDIESLPSSVTWAAWPRKILALKMGDLVGFSSGSASLGNVSFSLADSWVSRPWGSCLCTCSWCWTWNRVCWIRLLAGTWICVWGKLWSLTSGCTEWGRLSWVWAPYPCFAGRSIQTLPRQAYWGQGARNPGIPQIWAARKTTNC